MKALIEKLANGNVEYVSYAAKASVDKVEIALNEKDKTTFDFFIDSVNDRDVKGVVYSSDPRIEILEGSFFGRHNPVKIYISAAQLRAGTVIESKLTVTSNAGEIVIPCRVEILKRTLETGVGDVTSLAEFSNLVSYDYEDAFKLFMSPAFKVNVLKNDISKCKLYDLLIKNSNREIAMEEFLVAEGEKEKVVISLAEDKKEYTDITETYGDVLQLNRNCSGYVDIDVEIVGDILHNAKLKITNDDFVGNTYEYPYLINHFKLHQGENRAKIIFRTATQKLEYEIIINNTPADVSEYINYRKKIFNMMHSYISFRCGKITGKKWMADMLLLSDSMLLKNPKDLTAVLLKTQVSILSGDEDRAVNMLSQLSQMVNSIDPDKVDYYCYYLYLKTIHKKNSSYTEDIKREIKSYFENGYDNWALLWMIFYLDERYTQNPSLKYTLIKEQFNKGCHSPVMYYEALSVLNAEPALLRVINSFEVQVLNFGAKWGIINDKLSRQVMLLLEKDKNCSQAMLRIIMKIYETSGAKDVLEGICRMLINSDKNTEEYFVWFERGVEADIRLSELMESYVYSVSNQGYVLFKPSVYMYFGYSTQSLGDYQAYLFADIISNKDKIPEIYDKFRDEMVRYATRQLALGKINRDLAVIYDEIITESFNVPEDAEPTLVALANSYELKINNDNVQEVLVAHKETDIVESVVVNNGRAIVSIYTENPSIVFVDSSKRRLSDIGYTKSPMLTIPHLKEYTSIIDNLYVDINTVNRCMTAPVAYKDKSAVIMKVWRNENISSLYRNILSDFAVDYCSKNYDSGEMTDFLLEIDADTLNYDRRITLIETLIKRGMLKQVSYYINKYGFTDISKKELLIYVSDAVKSADSENKDKLLNMSRYLFMNDEFDETTLNYLQKYYVGPTDEMFKIWKICKEADIAGAGLEEKLIAQMIFEGRKYKSLFEVFDSYYQRGAGRNIRKAFYTYVSYFNFVAKTHPIRRFFEYVEKDIESDMRISEICKMEYLSFIAEKGKPTAKQLELCKTLLFELADLNIVFEYYKEYNKWFKLPYNIFDKTIIDYRTSPKNKVYIMYKIYDDDGKEVKSATEEMSTAFPGIFIKQLTMFFGERVTYTIVDKHGEEVTHSEEKSIALTDTGIYNDENKFGQINGMLIAAKVGREDALYELMKNYDYNTKVSEELFKIN